MPRLCFGILKLTRTKCGCAQGCRISRILCFSLFLVFFVELFVGCCGVAGCCFFVRWWCCYVGCGGFCDMVVFLWCGDDVLVVSLMEVSRMDSENNSVFGFVGPISVFAAKIVFDPFKQLRRLNQNLY